MLELKGVAVVRTDQVEWDKILTAVRGRTRRNMTPVGFRPGDFVEGGVVPVDRNLLWEKVRFVLFNYTKKDGTVVATTTAAEVSYKDDGGQEFVQDYSVGDPERFIPSRDGKTLEAIGESQALSKSSNFYLLINSLINAGFPESKLSEDISLLDGLYTYNIGLPEPKRVGLVRQATEGEQVRERVISVPSQILRLPWEKGKGKAAVRTPVAAGTDEEGEAAITEKALAFVADHLDESGSTTRQKLAVAVFKDLAKDPDKDAIASLIFSPEFAAALLANGYTVSDEDISKT